MFAVFTLKTMKATQIKHDNDNLPKASCGLHQIEKRQYIHLQY